MEITNANWRKILLDQNVKPDLDDKVVFRVNGKVYSYVIRSRYLEKISPYAGFNDSIFKEIELTTEKEKCSFCTDHYGYLAVHGFWPEFTYGDYDAARRIIIAIYNRIEGLEFDELLSAAQESPISVQEGPVSTEALKKNIDTIKITIDPIQTFKIVL